MKKIIRLTENDLTQIIKKIIKEESHNKNYDTVISFDDLRAGVDDKNIREGLLERLSFLCNNIDGKIYFTHTLPIQYNNNFSFKNLYRTDGLIMRDTNFDSIPNLEVVSGDVSFYGPITNFGNLKLIEGNITIYSEYNHIAQSLYTKYRKTGNYTYYEEYIKHILTYEKTDKTEHSYDFFNKGEFIGSIDILGEIRK